MVMRQYSLSCSANNEVEHLIENGDLPEDILKQVSGELVFEQTQPRVSQSF